jgi:hypothetical protein
MHRLPFAALALAALGLACGGLIEKADNEKPEEPAAPVAALPPVPPPPAPVAPPPPPVLTFAQVAFPCCAAHRANRILNEYLDLQTALVTDDLQRARAEAGAVRGAALAAAKDGSLSTESRALAQQVADISGQLKSGDLTQIRGGFGNLSDKVVTLAKANRGGTGQVAVAFSPKANATWLQKEAAVANPYFGKADATEGVFQE